LESARMFNEIEKKTKDNSPGKSEGEKKKEIF
jgi:hypothetical protein